ncbi:hemicentin-1-like [Mytilus trossulus]|uniref:hemicentin-1-like n=1 Tax=Mytilus trossulus TaxID=6551 RepID=UPI0030067FDB
MESIPEIDASPTVDSEDKHNHVCLKEQKEQHNLDRSQTHPKQLVQSEEDEGSLSGYGWSHDPGEVVHYSNSSESTTLPNGASTEDGHTSVNTSGEHPGRILSERSLNLESLLVQEISDNSILPTQNADRQPTVLSEDAGTSTNTYGYNTERISKKKWRAIKIFVLEVEQTFIASNKWLQFSEAIGYDMSVVRKKIGSEPKQFYKLLNEWLNVMKETERNPISYLKWALEEVDEKDLVTKLTQKFGSTHDIHDDDMDQLQTQLTSRDFSITVKPNTNEGHTIIQAATVVMGDRNVVTKAEGETKTANGCDRELTKQDSKENQSQDFANNLSSNVVDGPGETTGPIGHFDDVSPMQCGVSGLMVDGKQVVSSKLKYSAIVGQTCVIKVNIDDKYRHDHLIWRWKQNKEEEYTKAVSNSEKYNKGNVENPSLTIKCVQKTDEGYYRCQVVNAAGSVNSEDIYLEILGGIPTATVNVEGKVIRGTTVILHCEITSVPDFTSLTWLKNGDAITMTINNTKYNGGTNHKPALTIHNVDDTDKAVYTCEVTNLAGTGTSNSVTLNIINKPTVRIDGAALVLTGRTTTIGCTVSSQESVSELNWFKDEEKLQLALNSSKYGGGIIQTPSLIIRNVNVRDNASYRCEATNIAGTGQSKVVHLDVAGKPTIHLSYKSTVLRGNKSMIDCFVTSKIQITSIQWCKDGKRIMPTSALFSGGSIEDPSLTLNNFSKHHEGTYVCEVSNDAGTVSSDDAIIKIGDMPVISLPSLNYTVKAAGFVTLRCHIAGNPKPEIQWYRLVDGEKHIIKESLKYSGGTVKVPSLTITNVDGNDTGSYILNAHNNFGECWSEKVTVEGEIPRITLNSDASVLFGKTFTIVCLLESGIQTMNWFKDDCEISLNNKHFIGGKLDSPHLTITAVSKSDEGKYTCKGTTQFGTTISNTISIMVIFDTPTVTINESNISTEAGASIQLTCSIISEPSITRINWYKMENGKSTQISYSGRHTGGSIQQPFLSIMNANPNDSGVYFCEVENIAGKGRSRNIHLEIKEALPVISISKNLEGRENQPVKLICNIKSGLPVQSLLWYKEVDDRQREIFENGIKYEGGHSRIPELTILHCDKTDTGFYICRVANSFGQSSSEKCFLQVSYKPVITVPSEKNVMDGQSIDIDCSVDAKPDIDSLQWYRFIDGKLIELQQTSKHYTGGNKRNHSLRIVNIGKDDEGAYRCRASNSVGEFLSDKCQLKVSSKPKVLIEQSALSCTIGQSISIECRIQADPAVQHVQWLKKDKGKLTQLKQTKNETFEHSIKPSLTIRDVQTTDSGHYFCEATNIAGTTKSEPIVLDVATNIPDPSINIIVLAYNRCSVSIFKDHIVDVSNTLKEVNNIQIADFIIKEEHDQQYLETLNRKIPSAKLVFLLLSNDFVDEAWPNVSDMSNLSECLYSRNPPIVPVYLEPSIKLPMGLKSLQCLYLYRTDSAYKKALGKLLQGLF